MQQRRGDQVGPRAEMRLGQPRELLRDRRRRRSRSRLPGRRDAALKEWTNGCRSVDERSCFSYQVAAGRTTSEYSAEPFMRKSIVVNRSSFPVGASSCQTTSSAARRAPTRRPDRGSSTPSSAAGSTRGPCRTSRAGSPARASARAGSSRARRGPRRRSGAVRPAVAHDVVGRLEPARRPRRARSSGLRSKVGCERQPPEPRRRAHCSRRHAFRRASPVRRRRELSARVTLVAPLVAGEEPERRRRLLARRPFPVERERERRPAA